MLSHHLWAKVTELSQLPLRPSLMGTRCPKPAGNCWDVLMLPWAGKGKGLEVSPVPATPGDKPRGALPSRERWESSTFPRGHGWTPGSDRHCGMRNDEHSRQSKPHPASSALPAGTRSLCPCCSAQQLHFLAGVFVFPVWLLEQSFPPGALEHRGQMRNSAWLQPGRGTSQAGGEESAVCLEHP